LYPPRYSFMITSYTGALPQKTPEAGLFELGSPKL
jgi:hypothetical protein